ncbi:MAG: hypothetical protein BZY73_01670 [SAR202 cluster bacterium Casp-Chloro-G3]|nr:MAG: hypothetical protein BZY73_01670 [SAR202 cluster bacterium Casp-Chloro-G3]
MMFRASFIGILVTIGLNVVLTLFAVVPIPLVVGGLVPGLIGGFTGGFLTNRGFRGGVGSGALMSFLMVFWIMFFFLPGRFEMAEQFPGLGTFIQRIAPTTAAMVVGASIGGLVRQLHRFKA